MINRLTQGHARERPSQALNPALPSPPARPSLRSLPQGRNFPFQPERCSAEPGQGLGSEAEPTSPQATLPFQPSLPPLLQQLVGFSCWVLGWGFFCCSTTVLFLPERG